MTSLRIDSDKSAKVWAKRLGNFIEAIESDGGSVHVNVDDHSIAVNKDGKVFTSDGKDVSDDFFE